MRKTLSDCKHCIVLTIAVARLAIELLRLARDMSRSPEGPEVNLQNNYKASDHEMGSVTPEAA